jgi:hypothetical protein
MRHGGNKVRFAKENLGNPNTLFWLTKKKRAPRILVEGNSGAGSPETRAPSFRRS